MVRLRNALMIVALAAGAFGCAHWGGPHGIDYAHLSIFHCSECDDFPSPGYGPHGSMMPGTYSGPPPENSAPASRMATPASSNAPVTSEEAAVPPPDERPTPPPGAAAPAPTTPPAAPAPTTPPAAPPANP